MKRCILWAILFILVWVYISPLAAVALSAAHIALYVGGWYVILRLLGVIR